MVRECDRHENHRDFTEFEWISRVWSCGWNDHGQLGIREPGDHPTLQFVPSTEKLHVAQVSCGDLHSGFVTDDGLLFTFGSGADGRLGLGSKESFNTPQRVAPLSNMAMVVCGARHTMGVSRSGSVYTWGAGYFGRLGHGSEKSEFTPCRIGLSNVHQLVTRGSTCLALCGREGARGDVALVWGGSGRGQCVGREDVYMPKQLEITLPTLIAVGYEHCAVSNGYDIWTWGSDDFGQLGHGQKKREDVLAPKKVVCPLIDSTFQTIASISCGNSHTLCLLKNGTMLAWGRCDYQQLGHMFTRDQIAPKSIRMDFPLRRVVSGDAHVAGIATVDESCRLVTWGLGKHGQVARDLSAQEVPESNPTIHTGTTSVDDVICGGHHTMILVKGLPNLIRQHCRESLESNVLEQTCEDAIFYPLGSLRSIAGDWNFKCACEDIDDVDGLSAIHIVAMKGWMEVLSVMIECKVDLGLVTRGRGPTTPLHLAVANGKHEFVKMLIENNVDLGATNHIGETALHIAISQGFNAIAHTLISHESHIDDRLQWRDKRGKCPLQCCSFEDAFEFKLASGYVDVVIASDDEAFAHRLAEGFKDFKITAAVLNGDDDDVGETSQNTIKYSPAFVYAATKSSAAMSTWPVTCLVKAKELQRHLFPIWREKVSFEPELETLIFRYQLVDFSVEDDFNVSLSSLCRSVRNVASKGPVVMVGDDEEDEESVDQEGEDRSESTQSDSSEGEDMDQGSQMEELRNKGAILLLTTSDDLDIAKSISLSFSDIDVGCVIAVSSSRRDEETAKAAAVCQMAIPILSPSGADNSSLSEMIAVVENRGKPIAPLFTSSRVERELLPPMRYTFSKASKLVWANNAGYIVQQIVHMLLAELRLTKRKRHYHKLWRRIDRLDRAIHRRETKLASRGPDLHTGLTGNAFEFERHESTVFAKLMGEETDSGDDSDGDGDRKQNHQHNLYAWQDDECPTSGLTSNAFDDDIAAPNYDWQV